MTLNRCRPSLRTGPYRFYFYSHEPNEPVHVHVDRHDKSAKFWLQPVTLTENLGFAAPELRKIARLVVEHDLCVEALNAHSGS